MKLLLVLAAVLINSAIGQQSNCPSKSGYFKFGSQCDTYLDCVGGVGREKLCPDGLVFDETKQRSVMPCTYMNEVDCSDRPNLQPAQPNGPCKRSNGFFITGDRANCGTFYNCVGRNPFEFKCPANQAFSLIFYVCVQPEDSPDCDADAFMGFTCPTTHVTTSHPNPDDCAGYFLCSPGVGVRKHKCGSGTVFNDAIKNCDDQANVPGCQNYYTREELERLTLQRERSLISQQRRQRTFEARIAKLIDLNNNRT